MVQRWWSGGAAVVQSWCRGGAEVVQAPMARAWGGEGGCKGLQGGVQARCKGRAKVCALGVEAGCGGGGRGRHLLEEALQRA